MKAIEVRRVWVCPTLVKKKHYSSFFRVICYFKSFILIGRPLCKGVFRAPRAKSIFDTKTPSKPPSRPVSASKLLMAPIAKPADKPSFSDPNNKSALPRDDELRNLTCKNELTMSLHYLSANIQLWLLNVCFFFIFIFLIHLEIVIIVLSKKFALPSFCFLPV